MLLISGNNKKIGRKVSESVGPNDGDRVVVINAENTGYTIDQVKHAITVGELKSLLNYYDSDMQVYLSFDRGYTYGTIDDSDISEYAYSEEFEEWKEVY